MEMHQLLIISMVLSFPEGLEKYHFLSTTPFPNIIMAWLNWKIERPP